MPTVAKPLNSRALLKRLLPLYIGAFLQGLMLWYVVEKLFMRGIGFNDAGIGAMVAAYSVLILLLETPSGILADRWSRKGVLILASLSLALCSLICGLSNDPVVYIFGTLFWGLFFALYSGTYDAVVYDTLLEEAGDGEGFQKYYGWLRSLQSAAWVSGSLIGGVVAQAAGLRAAFFWSLPSALLSIVAIWFFKEPTLHKAEVAVKLKAHVKATFSAVWNRGGLLSLIVALVAVGVAMDLLYEFSQLWFIALAVPAALFGPAFGLVLAAEGFAGLVVGWVKRLPAIVPLTAILAGSLTLIFSRSFVAIVAGQALIMTSLVLVSIRQMRRLHDALPSSVRAGASSAISTLGRIVTVPTALAFGAISTSVNIFTSGWIMFGLAVVAGLALLKTRPHPNPSAKI